MTTSTRCKWEFLVEQAPESGYSARAMGESIFTESDSFQQLLEMIRDAIRCHFGEDNMPDDINITHDPETDPLRILLSSGWIEESCDKVSGIILDYDMNGNVVGIEIPDAGKNTTPGARLSLAVRLFEQDVVGLESAAVIAGNTISEMIDHLGALHIPVIRYSGDELESELACIERIAGR